VFLNENILLNFLNSIYGEERHFIQKTQGSLIAFKGIAVKNRDKSQKNTWKLNIKFPREVNHNEKTLISFGIY